MGESEMIEFLDLFFLILAAALLVMAAVVLFPLFVSELLWLGTWWD
jgi:uncharacterized membrane protein YqhA